MEVVGTSGIWILLDTGPTVGDGGAALRQRPGPDNARPREIHLPNHFSICDTGRQALFASIGPSAMDASIENPVGLAEYVLRDQPQWTAARISSAMHARQEQAVTLKAKLPVHIGYWTAWVEPDGRVTFADDPYSIDRAHARLMERTRAEITSIAATRRQTPQPGDQNRAGQSRASRDGRRGA
jgi:murein L,D-transpeptidase YcbB/YkuD